jgi:TRAP-type C4-dicarboxylate transport system permease small subunit
MDSFFSFFYRYVLVGGARVQFVLAGILIVAQTIVIMIDSAGSLVNIRSPFHGGGNELVQLQMGLIAAFCLAYTWLVGGHVRIELIVDKLKPRGQFFVNMLSAGLGLIFCMFVAIGMFNEAADAQMLQARTDMLRVPIAPVMYLFSVSFMHFSAVLIFYVVRNFLGLLKGYDIMAYMGSLQTTHLD